MKKLIPVLLLLFGMGGGIAAGLFLAPSGKGTKSADKETVATKDEKPEAMDNKAKAKEPDKKEDAGSHEYLKLTKQFVVPIVEADRIAALVTMSLSLEVTPGMTETVYAVEPKLRDRFLQVLFDHANTGGFNGNFTQSDNLSVLRKALLNEARKDLGEDVSQILIMSVNRQDT
ncbi:flagellar basal body-associated FliL family protein [Ruegeria sp. R14_0]|uniref:flagellar basal body-associated FliL family protein n=1 Tax=Ruegeria sp. R14_0 TaxID=2821100 RepID=UPI001ADB68E9|nr:flagellar basal body-associated FliL family protein [Ruegeria sp. R14_0]MBO9448040.1 flagellar basal body-associated FliL family protein [Ruegeria sp. R14_0]